MARVMEFPPLPRFDAAFFQSFVIKTTQCKKQVGVRCPTIQRGCLFRGIFLFCRRLLRKTKPAGDSSFCGKTLGDRERERELERERQPCPVAAAVARRHPAVSDDCFGGLTKSTQRKSEVNSSLNAVSKEGIVAMVLRHHSALLADGVR
jgi:hypothetical protein